MVRVFIIGGTLEARQVAEALHERGHVVMSSLAGVTDSPKVPRGSVRVGGYGGDAAMADFIRRWGAEALVDCAHPFAVNIKSRLARIAEASGLPLSVYQRETWQAESGDDWHYVGDLDEGMRVAAGKGARIFAALGRQQFARLAEMRCEFLLLRQVPGGSDTVPDFSAKDSRIISGYPSGDVEEEKKLLQDYAIDVILCKESGGGSGVAKLAAARTLSLPVVIIKQPEVKYPKKQTIFFKSAKSLGELIDRQSD